MRRWTHPRRSSSPASPSEAENGARWPHPLHARVFPTAYLLGSLCFVSFNLFSDSLPGMQTGRKQVRHCKADTPSTAPAQGPHLAANSSAFSLRRSSAARRISSSCSRCLAADSSCPCLRRCRSRSSASRSSLSSRSRCFWAISSNILYCKQQSLREMKVEWKGGLTRDSKHKAGTCVPSQKGDAEKGQRMWQVGDTDQTVRGVGEVQGDPPPRQERLPTCLLVCSCLSSSLRMSLPSSAGVPGPANKPSLLPPAPPRAPPQPHRARGQDLRGHPAPRRWVPVPGHVRGGSAAARPHRGRLRAP